MTDKHYFISADIERMLRQERGFTDETFLGLNIKVDNAMPAGKAYVIGPPEVYGPPRPPIQWIAPKGIALRPMQVVCLTFS